MDALISDIMVFLECTNPLYLIILLLGMILLFCRR